METDKKSLEEYAQKNPMYCTTCKRKVIPEIHLDRLPNAGCPFCGRAFDGYTLADFKVGK